MASMAEVGTVVMNYPKHSSFGFDPPDISTETIDPPFTSDRFDFGAVYAEFMAYLQSNGIVSNVPFFGMKQTTIWAGLVTLVWGSQTTGVH
ncbi:MAG TPA: hypothetical protein VG759_17560 [Candidatus Angelobacter sp.]|jgi:hypothetical protein|nr:hypothetical protein [Candidatus Angelobacter sp.]